MQEAHCSSEQSWWLRSIQFGSMSGYFLSSSRGSRCIWATVGPPSAWIMASASSRFPAAISCEYLCASNSEFVSGGDRIAAIRATSGLPYRRRRFGSSCSPQYFNGSTSSPVPPSIIMPAHGCTRRGGGAAGVSGACVVFFAVFRKPLDTAGFAGASKAAMRRSSRRTCFSSCPAWNSLSATCARSFETSVAAEAVDSRRRRSSSDCAA
mmetsp:Transcript_517/g.1319  ORF Transcript_517/g.1319 Transcript_517/m.1319 type:complete len:209 (-) Transcript_517:47-673(-)